MRTYVIYDRETGDVLHTHVSPGPIELGDEVIEELVNSGRLERAAFIEVDPGTLATSLVMPRAATRFIGRAPHGAQPPAATPPLRKAV